VHSLCAVACELLRVVPHSVLKLVQHLHGLQAFHSRGNIIKQLLMFAVLLLLLTSCAVRTTCTGLQTRAVIHAKKRCNGSSASCGSCMLAVQHLAHVLFVCCTIEATVTDSTAYRLASPRTDLYLDCITACSCAIHQTATSNT
jgi:hypothetical protein